MIQPIACETKEDGTVYLTFKLPSDFLQSKTRVSKIFVCRTCGAEFTSARGHARKVGEVRYPPRFCSRRCYLQFNSARTRKQEEAPTP
ncbi:MAG: hypothetical protein A2992_06465 [Elusimicrobia bacterium RIFCSPLOWO2_01_FULL_59_12]|nr:MAG: hypothetical protein A2992_06465 [Elusimicrobia bacterium RIFCSPLOWO2_01_FULL_59_12]